MSAHNVARREVLAGLLVVFLVEAANQFLENGAHRMVVEGGQPDAAVGPKDGLGGKIDGGIKELFEEVAQDVGLGEGGHLIAELELVENLLNVGREAVEIGLKSALSCCCLARALRARRVNGEAL